MVGNRQAFMKARLALLGGKAPYRVVCTRQPAVRYVGCLLPSSDSLSPRKETTRFAISICTAQYGQYIIPPSRLPVRRPLATGRYRQNRLSTIDFGRQRSIKGEIDRRRSIEGEKGKKQKRKRRNKERRGRKKTTSFPGAVLARTSSPPAGRSRAVLAHRRFFSRSRRQNFSRRGEKD
ncbi:hypothetical protein BHM03_00044029 [Ensete ventricosum]|nr:hypothetical protein BHM03_00044029 [Ensete ventricosum]